MPKRGKKVTEEKKAKVLYLLCQHYSVEYVASNQSISESEVRKIRREARRKEEQKEPEELRAQFKAQLTVPAPEAILVHNFDTTEPHSIPLKGVLHRVSRQNTDYNAGAVMVAKEKDLATAEDDINVVFSPDGALELFCPVEKHALFQELLSSLSQTAQEQFVLWKRRGGEYVAACIDVRWQLHTDANDRVFQLVYEIGRKPFTQIGQPYLTPAFGDTAYHFCILCHRSSGRLGIPAKTQYRVWQRSPIWYELYLGHRRLVTTPDSPGFLPPRALPPSFPPEILMRWAALHRDMIKEWSASPAVIELQELFGSLRRIEGEIKEELG